MAKHHNEVQHTEHVRTVRYPNGNQGFREHSIGTDTVPGPTKGAPLSSRVQQEVSNKTVKPDGMNPYNKFEGNAPGVLGPNVVGQHGNVHDSPVPEHASRPDVGVKSKAQEVQDAHAKYGDTFPGDGVMHR